jgi:hypothetical protein
VAEEDVKIRISTEGAEQAERQLGGVAQELGDVATGARSASQSAAQVGAGFTNIARTGQQTAQRIQGVASAVQTLVTQLGSHDRTAGLVASVAGATAQFAAMGSMLGPAGTVVGAVAGFASSIFALNRQAHELADAARDARVEVVSLTEAMADRARVSSLNSATASAGDYATEIDRITAAMTANAAAREELLSGDSFSVGHLDSLNREFRALSSTLNDTRELAAIAEREATAVMMEDLRDAPSSGRETPRRGGGRTREPEPGQFGRGSSDPMADDRINIQESMADRLIEIEERIASRTAEIREAELAKAQEAADIEVEIAKRQFDMMEELGREQEEQRQAADDAALESRRGAAQEAMGLLGDTTSMLGDSLKAIALGTSTAEEAFTGLAKAFLEMISQYATLKAAAEFAEAAGSAARYDWGGFAGHAAAGVAFTAVAVATGIGAGAIGGPPAPPAKPETSANADVGGRGGDVVINWNAPVVTASTRAELGRDISGMISEAGAI